MDKTLKKMSLTMVNDKKIVIYWKWSIQEKIEAASDVGLVDDVAGAFW